ncbi:MAG: dipeptidase PepV [Clostridia bacterium]
MSKPTVDWQAEVEKRKDELLHATQQFLQIRSVLDMSTATQGAPFGTEIRRAFDYVLNICREAGMEIKDVEGYAGHAEFGSGTELIGVLSHVDVVPEGDGWSVPPYEGRIVDGKLIARGAIDDKGPAMASVFAAKIVKELGLPLNKRVRLIFGTDEETSWRCVDRYFETEEMPSMGFTPDADFPIIYAEKGVTDLFVQQTFADWTARGAAEVDEPEAVLHSFHSGLRVNMVPDKAEAALLLRNGSAQAVRDRFAEYLQREELVGTARENGEHLVLTLEGRSAHGSTPEQGLNAGTYLNHFLTGLKLDARGAAFAAFVETYFHQQHHGESLGIAADDEEIGPLTVNTGVFHYEAEGEIHYLVNIRYPHSAPYDGWEPIFLEKLKQAGYTLTVNENRGPLYVDKSHPLITTLQRVWTEQSGQEANLIAIGGATYGRALKVGVAFGPLFPGRPDSAHQRDEHIFVDDLLKATALYAQAIYELARD